MGEIVFRLKNSVTIDRLNKTYLNRFKKIEDQGYGKYKVTLTHPEDIFSIAQELHQTDFVVWCEPVFLIEIVRNQVLVTPQDPLYPQQYYLNQNNGVDINAPQAWASSVGCANTRVAVVDDGVENHEHLQGRVRWSDLGGHD